MTSADYFPFPDAAITAAATAMWTAIAPDDPFENLPASVQHALTQRAAVAFAAAYPHLARNTEPAPAPGPVPWAMPTRYTVYPTQADVLGLDATVWCLHVICENDERWSIRSNALGNHAAMESDGGWTWELTGEESNQRRRYSLLEALALASTHVDEHRVGDSSANEAAARKRAATSS